jgi:hypothetical protein
MLKSGIVPVGHPAGHDLQALGEDVNVILVV